MRFVMVTTNIYHPLLKNELLKSKRILFCRMKGEISEEIPKGLPDLLKKYAKAVLTKQPEDLLKW